MAPLADLPEQERKVNKTIDNIAKTLYSFRYQPFRNALVKLIALIVFFFNYASIQLYLKLAHEMDLPIHIKAWFIQPLWYNLVWLGVIIVLGAIAVINKMRLMQQVQITIQNTENSAVVGLLAFGQQQAEVFKNLQRNKDIVKIKQALLNVKFHFGILTGASGTGKTSFLNAGLAPAINSMPNKVCKVATLSNSDVMGAVYEQLKPIFAAEKITCNAKNIVQGLTELRANGNEIEIILILDQFEQFFSQLPNPADRKGIIDQLKTLYDSQQVKMLLSIRTDFAGLLIELQKELGYRLDAMLNNFDLEKFTPQQVVAILKHIIVNEEGGEDMLDEAFLLQMANDEFADESGRISGADIQIVLWVLKGKGGLSANLNDTSFRKLGGMVALLQGYLETQLSVANYYNANNEGLFILLALINLKANIRAGQLTKNEIIEKLPTTFDKDHFGLVMEWLDSLRLIHTIKKPSTTLYELAHERLIEPIRNIENKTEAGSRKASQLLERRSNEWLGNSKDSRFLLNFSEYRLVKKYKALIDMGSNARIKDEFLERTYNKIRLRLSVAIVLVGGILITVVYRTSNYYKINQERRAFVTNALLNDVNGIHNLIVSDEVIDSLYNLDTSLCTNYVSKCKSDASKKHYIEFLLKNNKSPAYNKLMPIINSMVSYYQLDANLAIAEYYHNKAPKISTEIYNKILTDYFNGKKYQYDINKISESIIKTNQAEVQNNILKQATSKHAQRLVNMDLTFAKKLYDHDSTLSKTFANKALVIYNQTDSLKTTDILLKLVTTMATINDRHFQLYFDLLKRNIDEKIRESAFIDRDDDIEDIISDLTSTNSAPLISYSIELLPRFFTQEIRNEGISDIIEEFEKMPFADAKPLYIKFAKMCVTVNRPEESAMYLTQLNFEVKRYDKELSEELQRMIETQLNNIANISNRNSLKDILNKSRYNNSNQIEKTGTIAERLQTYLLRDYPFGVNQNMIGWIDSLALKKQQERSLTISILIKSYKKESQLFDALFTSVMNNLYKLNPSERIITQLLAFAKRTGREADFVTIITYCKKPYNHVYKENLPTLIKLYRNAYKPLIGEPETKRILLISSLSNYFTSVNDYKKAIKLNQYLQKNKSVDSYLIHDIKLLSAYRKDNSWLKYL